MAKEIPRTTDERAERKAGLFILITIVTVLIILFIIGKEKKMFKKRYDLITTFEHGGNIDKNTGITLAGLKVGNVTEVYINDENEIDVVMTIQKEYQRLIREDSVATLVFSLLKGSVIDITFGSPESRVLEDGDRILSAKTEEIADKVSVNVLLPKSGQLENVLVNKLPSLIDKVDKVFGIIDNLVDRLSNSSSDLNKLIGNFEEFSNQLNKSAVLEQSERLLTNAAELTSDVKGVTEGFPALLAKIANLVEESNSVLHNLKVISGDLKEKSPDLPHMIESAGDLMDDLSEVLDASKKSFLLKKHLKKTDGQQVMINEDRRDLLMEAN